MTVFLMVYSLLLAFFDFSLFAVTEKRSNTALISCTAMLCAILLKIFGY